MLGFYVSPTAKVIRRQDLGFKVSSERLEKPGIELTTPGLEGKWLNHYATEASTNAGINTYGAEIHKLRKHAKHAFPSFLFLILLFRFNVKEPFSEIMERQNNRLV